MTSKRVIRNRQTCRSKVRYSSRIQAEAAVLRHLPLAFRSYWCKFCHGWHLTSKQEATP